MTVTGKFLHIPPQITTEPNATIILIFNEFFVVEDSKDSHMKAIQRQISDPALETDFLNLVTNSPDLLGGIVICHPEKTCRLSPFVRCNQDFIL